MPEEWFYSEGDSRRGPVSTERLRELVTQGSLKPNDLVWKDGMPDWVEARTIPDLFPTNVDPERDDWGRDRLRQERKEKKDSAQEKPASPRGRDADEPEVVRERPRRSRYGRFEDDDDRPRRSERRRSRDDDWDDYDDQRSRRSGRRLSKPGEITAVGIMFLIGGILGTITMFGVALSSAGFCCLWPGIYFELIAGIFLIIRAIDMMNQDRQGPPTGLAVCQICFILNADVINMILGIVAIVLLGGDPVKRYYQNKGF